MKKSSIAANSIYGTKYHPTLATANLLQHVHRNKAPTFPSNLKTKALKDTDIDLDAPPKKRKVKVIHAVTPNSRILKTTGFTLKN